MKHQLITEANCDCIDGTCIACFFVKEGGMKICGVCSGYEETLTTDCPGQLILPAQHDLVVEGKIDFKDGIWIRREEYGSLLSTNMFSVRDNSRSD
jgi:hypothetical protein